MFNSLTLKFATLTAKRKSLIATLLFSGLGIVACSSSKPSDDVVQKTIASLHSGNGELSDWKKSNAEEITVNGQKRYTVEYVSAKKLVGSGWYWTRVLLQTLGVESIKPGLFHISEAKRIGIRADNGISVAIPQESTAVFKGQMIFKQTENGWVLASHDQSQSGYCNPDISSADCWKKNGW